MENRERRESPRGKAANELEPEALRGSLRWLRSIGRKND